MPCEADALGETIDGIMEVTRNDKIAYFKLNSRKYIWKEEGF